MTAANNLRWVSFLVSRQTINVLVFNCVLFHLVFVNVLLEIVDLFDMWIVLVVDIVGHEVNALKAPLDLTQIHFYLYLICLSAVTARK